MGETYAGAGVSIDAGEDAVDRIKPLVRSTVRPEVLGGIGGFGGLFAFDAAAYDEPVLVSTTDGVGTKALLATATGRYDTIGLDLVAMCVDDLVCQGAEPLFFLDYISIGKVDPDVVEQLVAGVAEGCRQAGCALVGGEMAEHAGVMEPGEFDLVGFAVGAVERSRMLTGEAVTPGDVLIALPSPGLRSNGYTLARRLMFDVAGRSLDDPAWEGPDAPTVADELLLPSVIYAPAIRALLEAVPVHSVAHITGGGLPGNLNRVIGDAADAVVDGASWEPPRIFDELQRIGDVDVDEMRRVFNLGVGMVAAVPADSVARAVEVLGEHGHHAFVIGEVVPGSGRVRFDG
ncbi:phosphoribosylformylglycinamidine cyclo-ligase [Dermatobacter hominis]|uniref:phosphoribosylformylglycinamidine cyclo-ligase n=1 Tax=Dermatobacter hominis TaxID=2884263 RepID=UPI001D122D11|nr:phosphoribosylformylglycinamidine cyclo-ligase [Dermatobacter hominis]UDY34091.1 phosphoribosylformylglycinamidine cyclo-ligase [Dermatobacter hominis]